MELGKRKRVSDGEAAADGKRFRTADGREASIGAKGAAPVPGDEEVEEFFAILKRVRVAHTYLVKRNAGGGHELVASTSPTPPWRPLFLPEDFDGGEKDRPGKLGRSVYAGLDLNLDPAADGS